MLHVENLQTEKQIFSKEILNYTGGSVVCVCSERAIAQVNYVDHWTYKLLLKKENAQKEL